MEILLASTVYDWAIAGELEMAPAPGRHKTD